MVREDQHARHPPKLRHAGDVPTMRRLRVRHQPLQDTAGQSIQLYFLVHYI